MKVILLFSKIQICIEFSFYLSKKNLFLMNVFHFKYENLMCCLVKEKKQQILIKQKFKVFHFVFSEIKRETFASLVLIHGLRPWMYLNLYKNLYLNLTNTTNKVGGLFNLFHFMITYTPPLPCKIEAKYFINFYKVQQS